MTHLLWKVLPFTEKVLHPWNHSLVVYPTNFRGLCIIVHQQNDHQPPAWDGIPFCLSPKLIFCSTSMATSGWFACFPMGLVHWNAPWQMPGGAVEISWVVRKSRGFSEASGTFRMASVFFFGGGDLRSCTRCFHRMKAKDFSPHRRKKWFGFSCFNYGKPGWNDAAETHAVTHGCFSSQYPIIFYFGVVQ